MGKIKSNLKSKYTNNKSTKKYKFVNGGPEWQNENQPTSMLQDKYDAEQRKIAEANAVIFGQKNAALLNQMQEQQLADKARVEAEAEKQKLEDAKAKSNIVQQGVVNKNLIGKNIKQNILQDKQNAANFINLGIQSGNYYSPTWAPTTPAITAQSVGYSAPIIGTEAAGTGSLTGSLMPGGVEVGQNLATTSASSIPTTGKTVVQAASGTGAALAGLGLNIAGEAVKYGTNRSQQKQDVAAGFSDYKSDATYTNKEFAGQVIGSTLKGAGTGIGIGSMVGGVGAVPAALIGGTVGLTYGLGKAIHEKRATTAEQDRGIKIGDKTYGKKLLFGDENVYSESKDPNEIARKNYEDYRQALQRVGNAADNALLSSRKSEINTGFSLKTGAGQQESFGYQAKYGGNIKYLKGGVAKSLGRGAVEYVGKKHEQGGIDLPGNIEVEGGETEQNDYIFSATLKLPNGATYAQAHKNLIQSGATGEEIHQLALSQEAAAGRNPNEIKSMKFAKYGGPLQYVKGGKKEPNKEKLNYFTSGQFAADQKNVGPTIIKGRDQQYWQDLECLRNPGNCISPAALKTLEEKYGPEYWPVGTQNSELRNAALSGDITPNFLKNINYDDFRYRNDPEEDGYNPAKSELRLSPKSVQYLERPFTDAEIEYYQGKTTSPDTPSYITDERLLKPIVAGEYSEETVKNLPTKTNKTKQPSEKYLKNQGFVDNVKQTPYGAIIYDPSTNTYETGLWSNVDESARAALPPVNFNTYKEAQEFGNKLDKYQKSNFSDPKLEQEIQTIFKDPKHQTEYGTYNDLNIKGKLKELYTGELATSRPLSQGDIDFYQRKKAAREKNTANQTVTPTPSPVVTNQTGTYNMPGFDMNRSFGQISNNEQNYFRTEANLKDPDWRNQRIDNSGSVIYNTPQKVQGSWNNIKDNPVNNDNDIGKKGLTKDQVAKEYDKVPAPLKDIAMDHLFNASSDPRIFTLAAAGAIDMRESLKYKNDPRLLEDAWAKNIDLINQQYNDDPQAFTESVSDYRNVLYKKSRTPDVNKKLTDYPSSTGMPGAQYNAWSGRTNNLQGMLNNVYFNQASGYTSPEFFKNNASPETVTTTDQTVNPTGITVKTGTEIRGTNNTFSKDLQDRINGLVTKYGDLDKVAEVTGINANSLQKILNDRAIDARDFAIVDNILNNIPGSTEVPATLARRNDVKIAPGAPVVDQTATTNTASPGVTYTTSDKVNPAAPVNPTDAKPRFFMGANRILDENGNVQILTDRPLMGTGAMAGSRLGTPSVEGLEDVRNNPYAQAATIKKDANYTTKNTGSKLSYSKAVSGKEDIAKTEWGKRWGYKPGMTDAEAKAAHDAFATEMRSKFDQSPDEMLGYYQYIIDAGAKIDDKGNRTYSGEDAYGDDARAIFENLKSKGYIGSDGKIKKEALSYLKTQATNEFVGPIHNAAGAYTLKGQPTPVKIQEVPPTKKPEETPPSITPPYLPPYKDYTTRNNLGLLQTIPPIAAAFNPLKAERVNAAMVPYSIRPAAVGNVNLGRMSYNAERDANQRNLVAMNQALQGIAGPGSVAGMLAAKTKADQQSMQIAQAEKNTNVGIANQEAGLNAEIAKFNAQSDMQAQTANAGIAQANAQRAQAANQYNSTMQFGANQENKEQLLGAIDTGVQAITQNELANRQLAATERLAGAMDYTGSYDRRLIYENLVKGSKDKNSELYGKSASELMQLVPYYDKQFYGDRSGVVVAANTTNNTTKKFGGIKKYISRLGDLNNNKTFKV